MHLFQPLNFNPDAQFDDGSCAFETMSNPVLLTWTSTEPCHCDLLIILSAFEDARD